TELFKGAWGRCPQQAARAVITALEPVCINTGIACRFPGFLVSRFLASPVSCLALLSSFENNKP
ncbi:MAG: hypothetical protein ACOYIE_10145, partial [Agathobaculum sp.]|uniref:hypothetical protein n=1 Tax=Agathobaculum sp. TaxID=2048138 RepID=UPI003D917BD7